MKAAFLCILLWTIAKSQTIDLDYDDEEIDLDITEHRKSAFVDQLLKYDFADLDILFSGFGNDLFHNCEFQQIGEFAKKILVYFHSFFR